MSKPLILLVDDDLAVLGALETELESAFGEICRVEVFQSGQELLDSVDTWEKEARPIAIAIVDQKMPRITGVELLRRLRRGGHAAPNAETTRTQPTSLHPARYMRSILLTGYAGLGSAIAAKNQAHVDAYIEKPWTSNDLFGIVGTFLGRHLDDTGMSCYALFREVVQERDLRDHLALRYRGYTDPAVMGMAYELEETAPGLDIGPHDLNARFFTVFVIKDGTEQAAGTIRVAGDQIERIAIDLHMVVNDEAKWRDLLEAQRRALPMMDYVDDPAPLEAAHQAVVETGEQVAEVGRFLIEPTLHVVGGHYLAIHTLESVIAFFFHAGIEHAFIDCPPDHMVLYRRYRFREIEGTSAQHLSKLDAELVFMRGRRSWIPEAKLKRIRAMTTRIAHGGGTCRCHVFPDCLSEPYENRNFREIDICCPLRARELLTERSEPRKSEA